jgi:hypothetical protein
MVRRRTEMQRFPDAGMVMVITVVDTELATINQRLNG